MISVTTMMSFGLLSLGMALTPGPNMVYLISRSVAQGPRAGLVALLGVVLGFVVYLVGAALGITAVLMAIPFAYDILRIAGALYLMWLASKALREARGAFPAPRHVAPQAVGSLFLSGLTTNLLNPKVAVLFLAIIPQFIEAERGNVFAQSIALGLLMICISFTVNGAAVLTAGHIASFMAGRPHWLGLQRWLIGTVLMAFAVGMLVDVMIS
jgi:threonine/homoserine/homoserine lactone efflux protein